MTKKAPFKMRTSGILASIEKQNSGGQKPSTHSPTTTPEIAPLVQVKALRSVAKGAIEPTASVHKEVQAMVAAKQSGQKLDRVKVTYVIDRTVAEDFEDKTLSMKMKGEKSAIVERLLRGYLESLEIAPTVSGRTVKSVKSSR